MFTNKLIGTTTPPPESVNNNIGNLLQVGTGTIASDIQQLRDTYRQAYQSALYYYQQAMQQPSPDTAQTANNTPPEPAAETIALVPSQPITIETHLVQHHGTAQNPTITPTQHQKYSPDVMYQMWSSYYQQTYDTYQQQLYSLTQPNDIAVQIYALSTTPDDGHADTSLQALSLNIGDSEDPDFLFSVEAINIVLSSLDGLKNYSATWDILKKLLPHINLHTEEKRLLISTENINVVLGSLNCCLLENSKKNYATTSNILLALQPHIESNTETNDYHISIENIENALHSINYHDTVYILPTLLPHIKAHQDYRMTQQDVANICRGLKDMAYIDIPCHPTINDILLMLTAHITVKPADTNPDHYFSTQDIGIMMAGLSGMSNIRYPGVDSFLGTLEPHIHWQYQQKQLDGASVAIILQGLEGKTPSTAVESTLTHMITLTQEISSLSAKQISMAVNGLRMLENSNEAKKLLLTLLETPISTENNFPSESESRLRVIIMLYTLFHYSQNVSIIAAATTFIKNNTVPTVHKIFSDGIALIQNSAVDIIPHLASVQGYDAKKGLFTLDLHDCIYPISRVLCEHVLKDFLERKNNSDSLTILVGQSNHKQGNANNMKKLVIDVISNEEHFDENWEWESPTDNSGQIIIYPASSNNAFYSGDDDDFSRDDASEDSANSSSSEIPGPPPLKKPKTEEKP